MVGELLFEMHASVDRPSSLPALAPCSTHTACSSSLVATHLAHTGLLYGEAHAAASCGIFMVLLPGTMSGISQLQVGGVGWWGGGIVGGGVEWSGLVCCLLLAQHTAVRAAAAR